MTVSPTACRSQRVEKCAGREFGSVHGSLESAVHANAPDGIIDANLFVLTALEMQPTERPPSLHAHIFRHSWSTLQWNCFLDCLIDPDTFFAIVDLQSGQAFFKPVINVITRFVTV